jgi:hypothetical protein
MLMLAVSGEPRLGTLASRTGVNRKPALDFNVDRVAE